MESNLFVGIRSVSAVEKFNALSMSQDKRFVSGDTKLMIINKLPQLSNVSLERTIARDAVILAH